MSKDDEVTFVLKLNFRLTPVKKKKEKPKPNDNIEQFKRGSQILNTNIYRTLTIYCNRYWYRISYSRYIKYNVYIIERKKMENKKLQSLLEHLVIIAIGIGLGTLLIWAVENSP